MFLKKTEAVMAEEFGEATLEAEISIETGEVQWMRQGVVIQPGPRHTLAQNGCKRSLTIQNLTISDRGTYRCETLHDRTQVKLNVERERSRLRYIPEIQFTLLATTFFNTNHGMLVIPLSNLTKYLIKTIYLGDKGPKMEGFCRTPMCCRHQVNEYPSRCRVAHRPLMCSKNLKYTGCVSQHVTI